MSYRLKVSDEAAKRLTQIISDSEAMFGEAAAHRYRCLILQCFYDLKHNPYRIGGKNRDDIFAGCMFWHMRLSRARAVASPKHPRHNIIYEVIKDTVHIIEILHEAMEPRNHLGHWTET